MKKVYETTTHCGDLEKRIFSLIRTDLQDKFDAKNFIIDSADKMTHKIPLKYDLDDERTIPIIIDHSEEPSTISVESGIINKMTEPINILRIYAYENVAEEADEFVKQRMKKMSYSA